MYNDIVYIALANDIGEPRQNYHDHTVLKVGSCRLQPYWNSIPYKDSHLGNKDRGLPHRWRKTQLAITFGHVIFRELLGLQRPNPFNHVANSR